MNFGIHNLLSGPPNQDFKNVIYIVALVIYIQSKCKKVRHQGVLRYFGIFSKNCKAEYVIKSRQVLIIDFTDQKELRIELSRLSSASTCDDYCTTAGCSRHHTLWFLVYSIKRQSNLTERRSGIVSIVLFTLVSIMAGKYRPSNQQSKRILTLTCFQKIGA